MKQQAKKALKNPLISGVLIVISGSMLANFINFLFSVYMAQTLSVSDNGIGFDQQYEQKIFELFQRLHSNQEYDGTGIGLAICKRIAGNHNGFIIAYGNPGKGSSFSVYIPEK